MTVGITEIDRERLIVVHDLPTIHPLPVGIVQGDLVEAPQKGEKPLPLYPKGDTMEAGRVATSPLSQTFGRLLGRSPKEPGS